MGFDEDFSRARGFGKDFPQVVSDMQAYKQLGNSVCPHAVKAIGLEVSKVLKLRENRLSKKVKVKASKMKTGKV
jgi:site-specific DNA-cytosine methylase